MSSRMKGICGLWPRTCQERSPRSQTKIRLTGTLPLELRFWLSRSRWFWEDSGHDPSEFYEGGLEKGGFSKLNLRKVRRGGGGGRTLKA